MQNIPVNSPQSVLWLKSILQPAEGPALALMPPLACSGQPMLQVPVPLLPRSWDRLPLSQGKFCPRPYWHQDWLLGAPSLCWAATFNLSKEKLWTGKTMRKEKSF